MKSAATLKRQIASLKKDLTDELADLLNYWATITVDYDHGGFVGKIDQKNISDQLADKGAVLNARILWSFAAAYHLDARPAYLAIANRAFNYIKDYFIDWEYGGVYWTVDYKGQPAETKKQVYAIAFTIYALSEYYKASGLLEVKELAVELYRDVIKYSYDSNKGGYFEAFSREWAPVHDLRLSDKDANESKTMNTHLHVLEAFTNLYKIWPQPELKEKILGLLNDFASHIIDFETGHLILFFDDNWMKKSSTVSYGHDIEASWLLLEAAEVIEDEVWIRKIKAIALRAAEVSLAAIDSDGGMFYEYDPIAGYTDRSKHWWVQAEGIVGFVNAWQLSGDEKYFQVAENFWKFIEQYLIDNEYGEWHWGLNDSGEIMSGMDKVGLWKCPYHNSRACMEVIRRFEMLFN